MPTVLDPAASGPEQRSHPRLASDVPVAFTLGEVLASESAFLNNISEGGASFNAMVELAPGTVLMMHFPPGKPVLRGPARVVWCRRMGFQFVVGVEFISSDPQFRQQMMKAVGDIESFRAEEARAGRALDAQQAVVEWFRRQANERSDTT